MSFTSASDRAVRVTGRIMLLVQLGDPHVRFQFGLVDNLAVLILFGISFIDRFVKGDFPLDRGTVNICSHLVAVIS